MSLRIRSMRRVAALGMLMALVGVWGAGCQSSNPTPSSQASTTTNTSANANDGTTPASKGALQAKGAAPGPAPGAQLNVGSKAH